MPMRRVRVQLRDQAVVSGATCPEGLDKAVLGLFVVSRGGEVVILRFGCEVLEPSANDEEFVEEAGVVLNRGREVGGGCVWVSGDQRFGGGRRRGCGFTRTS